jgi:hypothetical protein
MEMVPSFVINLVLGVAVTSAVGFLLNRFVVHGWILDWTRRRFEVDLRTQDSVVIDFGQTVRTLSAWLRYTNKSLFSVLVDQVKLDIWLGQPLLEGADHQSMRVPPGQTLGDQPFGIGVRFSRDLTAEQQAAIKGSLQRDRIAAVLTLNIRAYCKCWAGEFQVTSSERKCYLVTAVQGGPGMKLELPWEMVQ